MGKYIIDLPESYALERAHGNKWLQMPVNISGQEFVIRTVIPLTPYTEPDLDAVRNEAYKEAYDKGYQDAVMKIGSNEQAIAEKAYQGGLIDAWDVAKKIVLSTEDGGLFDYDVRKSVFGCGNYMALKRYSVSEAIEKIRQHEQEKKQEIKVGDEIVINDGTKGVVLDNDNNILYVFTENGITSTWEKDDIKKTGKFFPEIVEVLRKMNEKR